jgi:hypothetical protein
MAAYVAVMFIFDPKREAWFEENALSRFRKIGLAVKRAEATRHGNMAAGL